MRLKKNLFLQVTFVFLLVSFFQLPGNSFSQKTIRLKKEFSIMDNKNEGFLFKFPYNLQVDGKGNMYVLEKDQFLKFDSQGKFIKNLQKSGEGPGEFMEAGNYFLKNDTILIQAKQPYKLITMDLNGKLITEKRLFFLGQPTLFSINETVLYYTLSNPTFTGDEAKVMAVDNLIYSLPENAEKLEEILNFPTLRYALRTNEILMMVNLFNMQVCPIQDHLFYIVNDQEYQVKLVDFKSRKVVKNFKRDYKRVKVTMENRDCFPSGGYVWNGKTYQSPMFEFFPDIQTIKKYKNQYWVFTSTVDQKKGLLIDVLDDSCRMIDQIYLQIADWKIALGLKSMNGFYLTDTHIYIIDKDADENKQISKYRILE
jgi:hypothetical protein